MKYTILEILPGQIKVEYEDKSWALVPIQQNASPEDIDHEVSKYDPDFLLPAESAITSVIGVGEQRTSARKEQQEIPAKEEDLPLEIQKIREELASQIPDPSPITTNFSPVMPSIRFGIYQSGDIMAIAEYYAVNGDTRLKDKIMEVTLGYIQQFELNIDDIITTLDYNYDPLDDIVAQAEAELNQDG
jgi:hypothetical protein